MTLPLRPARWIQFPRITVAVLMLAAVLPATRALAEEATTFRDCYARGDGGTLVLGNTVIERTFDLRNHRLASTSIQNHAVHFTVNGKGYFLVFREYSDAPTKRIATYLPSGWSVRLSHILGQGEDFSTTTDSDGRIEFALPERYSFVMFKHKL